MSRRTYVERCCQCRKPVDTSDRTLVVREGPAGLNMNRLHRIVKNYWHAECWAEAECWAAEARREAEEQHRDTMRALTEGGAA